MIERQKGMSDKEYSDYIIKCNKFDKEQRDSQRPKFITADEAPVAWLVIGIVVFMLIVKIIKGQ